MNNEDKHNCAVHAAQGRPEDASPKILNATRVLRNSPSAQHLAGAGGTLVHPQLRPCAQCVTHAAPLVPVHGRVLRPRPGHTTHHVRDLNCLQRVLQCARQVPTPVLLSRLGACKPVHRCACCVHDARFSAWEGARRPLPVPSGRGRLLLNVSASCVPPMGSNSPLMPGAARTRAPHTCPPGCLPCASPLQPPSGPVLRSAHSLVTRSCSWAGVCAIAPPLLRTLWLTSAWSRTEARARCGRRGRLRGGCGLAGAGRPVAHGHAAVRRGSRDASVAPPWSPARTQSGNAHLKKMPHIMTCLVAVVAGTCESDDDLGCSECPKAVNNHVLSSVLRPAINLKTP